MEKGIERDIVAFATDSIMTRSKIEVDSEALGEFSFERQASDCYLLQNGYYRMNGKWKNRGIASMNSKTIKHLDTYVKNEKLFLKIQESRSTLLRSGIILNRIDDSYNDPMPLSMNYFSQV